MVEVEFALQLPATDLESAEALVEQAVALGRGLLGRTKEVRQREGEEAAGKAPLEFQRVGVLFAVEVLLHEHPGIHAMRVELRDRVLAQSATIEKSCGHAQNDAAVLTADPDPSVSHGLDRLHAADPAIQAVPGVHVGVHAHPPRIGPRRAFQLS